MKQVTMPSSAYRFYAKKITLSRIEKIEKAPCEITKVFRSMDAFYALPDSITAHGHVYVKKQDEFRYHSGECPCCHRQTGPRYGEAIYVRKDLTNFQ